MVCETAEELRARLALRAIWAPGGELATCAEEDVGHASALHAQLRAETEAILRCSLERRLKRVEKRVAVLCGEAEAENGGAPVRGDVPPPTAGPRASAATQTEEQPALVTEPLSAAMRRALQVAAAATRPPTKAFGASNFQSMLPDPKEEREDGFVSETFSMKGTIDSLGRSLGSRERQIESLQDQLDACRRMYEERAVQAEAISEGLRTLVANPEALGKAQHDRVRRRRARVAELSAELHKSQEQAKHYQALAQQQRAFFLQGERIGVSGGAEALARHPAGDVALAQRPPPIGDERPEVWDVGTAIANPYVVDSWPFEPNVLAARTPKEATLKPCAEETDAQLEEERRRLPYRAGLQLRLPGPGRDDDEEEYDDRYMGPSETSRSL